MTCKAIIFDLDGTLVDSREAIERSWRQWALDNTLDLERLNRFHQGRTAREIIATFLPDSDQVTQLKLLEEAENSHVGTVRPFPNVLSLLKRLPRDRWAIVTSGTTPIALPRIQVPGLPMPDVLVTANDVAHGKPHPEPYLLGAKKLGIAPEDCIVVEDSPPGIDAALAAGMRCIAVMTTHEREAVAHATAVVPNVSNLRVSETESDQLAIDYSA